MRGLVYIQQQNNLGKRPGVDEISREINAPRFFTAKILQGLVKRGYLKSVKGKGGGFYFEKDSPELLLRDLIVAVEGDQRLDGCGFGLKTCSDKAPCPIHHQYAPIRQALQDLVGKESIQSLATGK